MNSARVGHMKHRHTLHQECGNDPSGPHAKKRAQREAISSSTFAVSENALARVFGNFLIRHTSAPSKEFFPLVSTYQTNLDSEKFLIRGKQTEHSISKEM